LLNNSNKILKMLECDYLYSMGRWMAFDYGTKRTGIAVTDPLNIIATGLATIESVALLEFIKKYISTEQVSVFVVGEPKQMDNTPSMSAQSITHFVAQLNKVFPAIPVKRIDERFTSKMASQVIAQSGKTKKEREKKEHIDLVSATIILQSYMESTSN
jgi:putative Holliday junction resolvase